MAGLLGHGDAFVLRDPAGVRPAFWYEDDEICVVASERPAIQTAFNLQVEDSETKAAGAGAIGMETKITSKNKLKLGKWSYNNFNIVLFDLTHVNMALTEHNADEIDGIIGADILEKGKAIIDYNKKCLFLRKLIYKF